jgi:PAS domain S-box-containing protein
VNSWLGLDLILGALTLVAGIWLFYLWEQRTSYDAEYDTAVGTAENIAQAIEENTLVRIQAVDSVIKAVRSAYQSDGPEAARRAIRAIEFPREAIISYVFTDADGHVVLAEPPVAGPAPDLGDRPHIMIHAERRRDELFIGIPVFGRVVPQWVSAFTRPILGPGGSFQGVIAGGVNPFHLSQLYNSYNLGPDGAIALIGMDGVVRSRSILTEEMLKAPVTADPAMLRALAESDRGVVMQTSPFDGVLRLTAFRKLKDQPLVVMVGIAEHHIRARAQATNALAAAVGSCLVLLLAIAIWLERRSAAARRALKVQAAALDRANRLLSEQVAERIASGRTLHDATETLRGIIDAAQFAIIVIDENRKVTIWNRAAEDMFGWTAEETLGKPSPVRRLSEIDPADGYFERIQGGEVVRGREIKRQHKDGRLIDVRLSGQTLREDDGGFRGIVYSMEDVTERKRADRALGDTTEMLHAVVDASPVPIFSVDRNHVVTIWNRAAEETLGWSAAEVIGHPLPETRADPDDDSATLTQRVIAGGEIRNLEVQRRRKDGRIIDINASAGLAHTETGEVRGVVFLWEDITTKRQMERQLAQNQKMEAVGQLSGGVAHDFNNLLGVIVGNLDMVGEEPGLTEPAKAMVDAALDAAIRGSDLVRRLLAFSRRQMLQPTLVEVQAVVAELMPLIGRTLGEAIEISIVAESGSVKVRADRAQLESALINLAANARDAMPRGGKLVVATSVIDNDADPAQAIPELKPGRYAVIRVTDTGHGIAPDVLPHVFEPFFSTRETGQGAGLGLSMVYGFISQSGGTVTIDSEIGRGTTVTLYLPAAETAAEAKRPIPATDLASLPRGTERILVVEDNADMRRVGVSILASLGYQVAEAGSPAEALALIDRGETFDLVFTDVVMPGGLTGFDLVREIGRRRPGLRTLIASGHADAGRGAGAPLEPVAELLAKPYRKAELALRIRDILDRAPDNRELDANSGN